MWRVWRAIGREMRVRVKRAWGRMGRRGRGVMGGRMRMGRWRVMGMSG